MRVGQVIPTTIFGPYANGSNRPFTITAHRAYDRLVTRTKERGTLYVVHKLNRKGGDHRLRPRRSRRPARMLLRDRDGGVAVRGVCPGHGVLRDVLGGLLLVDGIWAGAGPVGVVRRGPRRGSPIRPFR